MNDTYQYELASIQADNESKVSTMIRMRYYAGISEEEKKELQKKYIKDFVNDIIEKSRTDKLEHCSSIMAQPTYFYPFHQMIEDIKKELRIDDVQVTKVIISTRKNKYVCKCYIYWKKIS